MKQRLLIITLLAAITLSGMTQTIGETIYIYRNNGIINGFLPNEVQSIEFSYEDADGNTYDEIVTQIVNTADSVYMIPLAEIDSVSFVTPKTEYKPGVVNLSDELMPYVVSSSDDPLSITFSSSTPASLMPSVGDKLVTIDMNEKFPAGFAGEVTSVSGSVVICQLVSLEDIFKTFSSVSSTYGYQEGANARRFYSRRAIDSFGNRDFKLGTYTWSKSTELSVNLFGSDKLALKGGTQLSIGITPSFHVVSTLIINDMEGTFFGTCITGVMTFEESLSVYGGIEWSQNFLDKEWVKAPVAPLTFFYVKPGLFFRAAATVSATATWMQRYKFGTAFDFSTKKRNVIKPTFDGHLVSSSFDIEGAIDGSMALGGFIEVGLSIGSSDIDNLSFRGELGAEMVGHAVLYNSDVASASRETQVYERFKNSNIALNAFATSAVQAKCGPLGVSTSLPWNLSYNIKTWDVVPTFSNTTFKQKLNSQTSADASVEMSGDCLFPVEVGLSVRDDAGNEIDGIYAASKFDNGNKSLSHTFTNLAAGNSYSLYPKVKVFGYEMLASPSAEQNKTEMPVKITEFKQTGSSYLQNGYTNNGRTYSYKYDCAVTVELTNSENVEDWGYVYEDPDGQQTRISLKSYGSPYTDTRYVYYRDEASSTVCLYEYVKFAGDSEYYYGEPKDYEMSHQGETSCPDNNHPHWIDLGIGTLWRCCNVDASSPEEFGGYYTFEQAQAYNPPSMEQIRVLVNNCRYTWTTQNGVTGGKFTGPNGGTIFLPAAGFRWDDAFISVGLWGCNWSSTPYGEPAAYVLGFDSEGADWGKYWGRSGGRSVRPVR